jgi:hypothetical protein
MEIINSDKRRLPRCMNHVGTVDMNPEKVLNDSYIHFMGLRDVLTLRAASHV